MSTAEYRFRVDPGEQPEWIDRSIVQSRRSNALRARLCCFLLCIPPVSHGFILFVNTYPDTLINFLINEFFKYKKIKLFLSF